MELGLDQVAKVVTVLSCDAVDGKHLASSHGIPRRQLYLGLRRNGGDVVRVIDNRKFVKSGR